MIKTARFAFLATSLLISACGRFDFGLKYAMTGRVPDAHFLSLDATSIGYGGCSRLDIKAWAEAGVPGAVRKAAPLVLSGLRVSDRIFSDSQCQNQLDPGDLVFSPGTTMLTIYVRAGVLSPIPFEVTSDRFETVQRTISVQLVVARLAFTHPQAQMNVGAGFCNGPISIQLQDANGSALSVGSQDVKVAGADGLVYSDSLCNNPLPGGILQIRNSNNGAFYVRRNFASSQPLWVTVSDPAKQYVLTDQLGLVFESVPYRLRIAGGPALGRLTLGVCEASAYRIELLDVQGNLVSPKAGTTVRAELGTTGGTIAQYRNSCGGAGSLITNLTFNAGDSSKNFFVEPRSRSSISMRSWVNASLIFEANQAVPVDTKGVALGLGGPATLVAGSLSAAYEVTLLDGLGVPFAAPAGGVVVELSGSLKDAALVCSAAPCASNQLPQGRVTIASGATFARFFVLPNADLLSGQKTLIATAVGGGLASASYNVNIGERVPTQFRISGGPGNNQVELGLCQSVPFTVELLDSNGELVDPATGTTLRVNLDFSSGAGEYRASCGSGKITYLDFGAGETSKSIYLTALARSSVTLRASQTGLTSGTKTVTVLTVPVKLALSGPTTLTAGTLSAAYRVTLKDGLDAAISAPAGGVVGEISGTVLGAGTLCSGAPCAANPLALNQFTISAGSNHADFYYLPNADLTSGTRRMSVAPVGVTLSGSLLDISIAEREPSQIRISGGPVGDQVDLGVCHATPFNVELLDSLGQPVTPAGGSSLVVSLGFQSGSGEYRNSCGGSTITQLTFSDTQSTKTFHFTALSRSSVNLRATATGLTAGTKTLTVITVPNKLGVGGPNSLTAGIPAGPFTVTVQDILGGAIVAPAGGVQADIAVPPAVRASFCSSLSCPSRQASLRVTIPAGQTTASFFLLSDADTSLNNQTITATPTVALDPGSLSPDISRTSLSFDTGFGSGGKVSSTFGGYSGGEILASHYQDGKLTVVGYVTAAGLKRIAVARYLASRAQGMGVLDTSFDGDGFNVIEAGEESWAVALIPQGTSYLIAGVARNTAAAGTGHDVVVFRISQNGSLDPSFRPSNDLLAIPGEQFTTSMAVGLDGVVYAVGYGDPEAPTASNTADVFVAAFQANGAAIANGFDLYDFADSEDVARAAVVQNFASQDKLVIGATVGSGAGRDFGFLRIHGFRGSAGGDVLTPDASWGSGGFATFDLGTSQADHLHALIRKPTGELVAAGSRDGGSGAIALVGLTSAGSLDGSFGSGGIALVDVLSTTSESARSIAIEPRTGALYIAGQAGNDFVAARLDAQGHTDGLSPTSIRHQIGGGGPDWGRSIAIGEDEKPLLSGAANGDWTVLGLLR